MKKYIFFLIFFFIPLSVYPFWIWSPKTKQWKNPQYSPLATPKLQFEKAKKAYEKRRFNESRREFRKLLINFPDSKEAAEAQYFLGRCLEKTKHPYEAFLEYQKVLDSYPNSKRIKDIIRREYYIGEAFLNRDHKQWLGMNVYDFVDHPSIEIFKKIVEKTPYSEYAQRAQYKLGLLFMKLSRFEEAREAFQKVIDNYPDSEWAGPAKYQVALATVKAFPGVSYDSTYLEEASKRIDEFIKQHPDAEISSAAEEQLNQLRNKEAKKRFDIAQFYAKQNKIDSALVYYKMVISKYPDSLYAQESEKKIEELSNGKKVEKKKKWFFK